MGNRKTILNPILEHWLGDVELPTPRVDCKACSRSEEASTPEVASRWRTYKCCTFQPFVANFYCGAMLKEGLDPLAIEPGKAVLQPLGVLATAEYKRGYYATPNDLRGEHHSCSFYDRGRRSCKVWKLRPGECSLYFCGDTSGRAAREAMSKRVFVLESSIAQMALAYYGLTRAELSHQVECLNTPEPRMASLRPDEARDIYRFAWEWLQTQNPQDVLEWVSFDKVEADG